jgi:hypothetical protein
MKKVERRKSKDPFRDSEDERELSQRLFKFKIGNKIKGWLFINISHWKRRFP